MKKLSQKKKEIKEGASSAGKSDALGLKDVKGGACG